MNLTKLEKTALESIINNDYQYFEKQDAELINSPTWVFVLEDAGISGKTLSGVISSLTKKGFVSSDYDSKNPNDSTICITELGYKAINQ